MEFKTTQGGETTLVFDADELTVIECRAATYGTTPMHVIDTLTRLRQANPLASFEDLVAKLPATYGAPQTRRAGVAPAAAAAPWADPLAELETEIRRKLTASVSGQATSQMQQTHAILLQALAVCLQTRMLMQLMTPQVVIDG